MPDSPYLTERMAELIKEWEQRGDRRAIFLGCYALMTGNILIATKRHRFEDDEWVLSLIHHFASYYFNALEAYEGPAGTPPVAWRITHDAARDPETMVLQNLLLGINAHVNYDLALAVTDLLDPEWTSLSSGVRKSRYHDYCQVNQIIADTVDSVQDRVVEKYAPLMEFVDILLGPIDEWFASQLINNWRDEVWQEVVAMLESPLSNRREQMRQSLEKTAVERAKLLLAGRSE